MHIRSTESPDLRKNSNLLNVGYHDNSLENCVQWTGRKSRFIEKLKFAYYTISWKFNGKLSTLDVQKDWIHEKKIEFIGCTESSKSKEHLVH